MTPPVPGKTSRSAHAAVATRHALWRLWRWPLALGLLSASGLGSALVSDSWGDAWSWFALGLPVGVMAACVMRR